MNYPPPPYCNSCEGKLSDDKPELEACQKREYYSWIDVAKGIGILLVILGHCIFPFVQLINYFHMPLFFILAGITFRLKSHHSFLLSKVNRIMIPYIFFAIVSALISFIPHGFGGPFNGPLWFLQNLFIGLVIMHIVSLVSRSYQIPLMALVLAASIFLAQNGAARKVLPFYLSLGLLSSVFIYLGYLFKGLLLKHIPLIFKVVALVATGVLFLGISYYADKNGLHGNYVAYTLFQTDYLLSFVLAILGASATILASILIGRCKWLEYLGRNSMCIMAVHFPLAMFLNGFLVKLLYFTTTVNKLLVAISQWSIVLLFSLLMCYVLKKHIPQLTGYKVLIK